MLFISKMKINIMSRSPPDIIEVIVDVRDDHRTCSVVWEVELEI